LLTKSKHLLIEEISAFSGEFRRYDYIYINSVLPQSVPSSNNLNHELEETYRSVQDQIGPQSRSQNAGKQIHFILLHFTSSKPAILLRHIL
jgi:hypothetical protein